MSINASSSIMMNDVSDIVRAPDYPYSSNFVYEIKLHTVDKDLDERDGISVTGLTIYRDYVNNMSDYIEIKILSLLGTYVYDIYKYLNNVEVTLYKIRQGKPNGEEIFVPERYKAVYLLERNLNLPSISSAERDTLNQDLPVTLTLQLINRSSEGLRIKTLQGSFGQSVNKGNTDMNVGSLMKSILSNQSDMIRIEGKKAIDKLDIEEVHNKKPLKDVTLPTGTRLVELPEYLQNKSGGVYTSGIGIYLQTYAESIDEWSKTLFVYSLYDASKYHESDRKIIFYSPSTSTYSMADNSYTYEDGILRVVIKHIPSLQDTKESIVMSSGIGFKSTDASSIMHKSVNLTPEGPEFSKEKVANEIIHKERDDGINFAPVRTMSSNQFVNASEVYAKVGKYVSITVPNLDLDFIYPGAACKIVYEGDDGILTEAFGVIHRVRCNIEHANLNLLSMMNNPEVKLNSSVEMEVYITQ